MMKSQFLSLVSNVDWGEEIEFSKNVTLVYHKDRKTVLVSHNCNEHRSGALIKRGDQYWCTSCGEFLDDTEAFALKLYLKFK